MHVAFPEPRWRDPYEPCVLAKFVYCFASAITHSRTEPADKLVYAGCNGPFMRDPPFNSLRHKFFGFNYLPVHICLYCLPPLHPENPSLCKLYMFCPDKAPSSPGLSSVPAKRPPIITQLAPAAMAFVISPEYLMPPSAIIGMPAASATSEHSFIAVNCGTPAPATILVVQIDPGPTPTFTALAPALIRSFVAFAEATLPPMISMFREFFP